MKEKVESLLAQMTPEEKIALLAGADTWNTVAIPRLGIPALKTTDGPIGARGENDASGPTSACFPCGTALAATWNPELVRQVGRALADETRAKGAHILLAPTVNIHRSPLAGRNFECYSEDPYLTAQMATAYISGLQSGGVGACIKHFVCNDQEFERTSINAEVGERALREIYLRPFELAIRDSKPYAVMSSYNRLNGTYTSEDSRLLIDLLKGEWGFEGIVISDWYGTYSPNVAKGGVDLEMPGPARWMEQKLVQESRVSTDMIDDKVRRLLGTIEKFDAFDQPEQAIDVPEHRRIARQAATEAIVLLKNSHSILPLDGDKSIAVIGASAKWPSIMGGGSVRVSPHYVVSPLEAIRIKAGERVQYSTGCGINKLVRLFDPSWLAEPLTLEYFGNRELAGEPVHTDKTRKLQINWFGDKLAYIEPDNFSVRVTGSFVVPESGAYDVNLTSVGNSRLLIDGNEIVGWGVGETVALEFTAGQSYRLQAEYICASDSRWRTLRIGCMRQIPKDSIQQAVAVAARADVAIVFVGLTDEWESESFDRPDLELPGAQTALIEQVSAANPNTIVVLSAGSPIRMDWLDRVAGVVQAWYLGQETGNAIADVLFGDVNPSGKLPTTFPKRLQDNPAFLNYPGENGRVVYGEGLFVGYRYYDKKDIAPLFPFGYGLSYTTFACRNLVVDPTGAGIGVRVDVQNTGDRAGQEILQLYVRDIKARLVRPDKELKAFAKIALEQGESRTVAFTLDQGALSYYDPAVERWVAESGEFEVLVGSSSRDIRLSARFDFECPEPPQAKATKLNIALPLRMLLDDPHGKAVLRKHFGDHLDNPQLEMVQDMTPEQIARFVPDLLTPELLRAIDEDLKVDEMDA